jgi:hypothetical protein
MKASKKFSFQLKAFNHAHERSGTNDYVMEEDKMYRVNLMLYLPTYYPKANDTELKLYASEQ